MPSLLTKLSALLGLAALAAGTPTPALSINETDGSLVQLERRAPNCNALGMGLARADCDHMARIGFAGQGANPTGPNGQAWIGNQGPNRIVFTNQVVEPVALILWIQNPGDYAASFMVERHPIISYTLAGKGASVTVSLANGVSGAFAALYNRITILTPNGQIKNTWGEFTTGGSATVDVTRMVHMAGNKMSIRTQGGCVSDMGKCVFVCKSGDTCWEANTYNLQNCAPGSQPYANYGLWNGQPEGGCGGWSNGGRVDVSFL